MAVRLGILFGLGTGSTTVDMLVVFMQGFP